MKEISFKEAVERVINNEYVCYKVDGCFYSATKTNILTLDNLKFYISEKIDKQIAAVRKSESAEVVRFVTLNEAIKILQQDGEVYYFDNDHWALLSKTSNIPFDRLLDMKLLTKVQARAVSFIMKQRKPPVSKRDCFEFQNDEFDISIYGKKGTIPCSGKGIRVKITEIL
jgi:hypothetical protein